MIIFFTSSLLVIFVLRNDPTLKGFGSPKTSQVLSFSSWEEGIEKVGTGLRDGYFNKNLTTIEEIMRYFTPRSDGSWARDVSFIMEQIEK